MEPWRLDVAAASGDPAMAGFAGAVTAHAVAPPTEAQQASGFMRIAVFPAGKIALPVISRNAAGFKRKSSPARKMRDRGG